MPNELSRVTNFKWGNGTTDIRINELLKSDVSAVRLNMMKLNSDLDDNCCACVTSA